MDEDFYDVEIAMHAFRMMRNRPYQKAKKLLQDLQADFPDIPEERLKKVMGDLCRRLMEGAQ